MASSRAGVDVFGLELGGLLVGASSRPSGHRPLTQIGVRRAVEPGLGRSWALTWSRPCAKARFSASFHFAGLQGLDAFARIPRRRDRTSGPRREGMSAFCRRRHRLPPSCEGRAAQDQTARTSENVNRILLERRIIARVLPRSTLRSAMSRTAVADQPSPSSANLARRAPIFPYREHSTRRIIMLFGKKSLDLITVGAGRPARVGRSRSRPRRHPFRQRAARCNGPYGRKAWRKPLFAMGCFWGVERIFWQVPGRPCEHSGGLRRTAPRRTRRTRRSARAAPAIPRRSWWSSIPSVVTYDQTC